MAFVKIGLRTINTDHVTTYIEYRERKIVDGAGGGQEVDDPEGKPCVELAVVGREKMISLTPEESAAFLRYAEANLGVTVLVIPPT